MSDDLQNKDEKESKASVIASIKTYLSFFALVILVAEGILGFLAAKATGADFMILVIVMAVVPLAAIICVFLLSLQSMRSKGKEEPAAAPVPPEFIKHEVFLSSPMAAFENEETYQKNRENVLKLADSFRKECLFKSVVFTGKEIGSIQYFEAADLSARDDIEALKESKYFVLYYSEKMVSSVLFEAGVALALRKPSLYLVKNREDLPFLMREAEQAFPGRVKIYEGANVEDFVELICLHRDRLFPVINDK